MSRYRRVLTRIWEDDKFPYLADSSRLLFLYHLTSPRSTPFLLYVEGPGAIADALRWPPARLRDAMADIAEKGLVWYADDGSHLLCLPNALTIAANAPESPNAVKTWLTLFRDLPKTPFRDRCLRHWLSLGVGIGHAFTHAFVAACALASPIQEQEQEQEQEQDSTTTTPFGDSASPSAVEPPSTSNGTKTWGPEELVALYNRLSPPGHPRVERLSPARRKKALAYLRQFPDQRFWVRVFTELRHSAFLQGLRPGTGHDGFRGDFDWLLTKGKDGTENAVKTAEGRYRDR